MAGGEDLTFPFLNTRLLNRPHTVDINKLIRLLESGDHSVPQGEQELLGSQNLFWLKAGAERELWPGKNQRANTDDQLIMRLERERDVIGLWGSEQTSPIYHHFTITGMASVYINSANQHLKYLIVDNLASFFWYAKEMGLYNSPHGLIGQRGTGHNFTEHGFPDLHFFMRYFLGGRPARYEDAGGWKNFLKDSGWVYASLKRGRLYDLMKLVFERVVDHDFKPWGVMIPIHFLDVGAHFMERGTNGNTPELGAYYNGKYLPVNEKIRVRQRASRGEYTLSTYTSLTDPTWRHLFVNYSGIYLELPFSGDQRLSIPNPHSLVRERVASMSGISEWVRVSPSRVIPNAPVNPPASPPPAQKPHKKKPWWKRIFGGLFE